MHADAYERVEQLSCFFRKMRKHPLYRGEMRCALGSHCPGAVGVCFEQAVEHTL